MLTIEKSVAFKLGWCEGALDTIIEHLGAAKMQRSPKDDKIIADHIDAALNSAISARRQCGKVALTDAEGTKT